jgi:hypothetical protein
MPSALATPYFFVLNSVDYCDAWDRFGIITGLIGFFSTLGALNAFADSCFRDLGTTDPDLSMTKRAGPAFVLLLVATILKAFDVWAHVIVPVPERDYWTPATSDDKKSSLIDNNEI